MRTFKPVLAGKGLLAASVALLSGQALAETAGRVSFVTGEVTASTADGSSRLLKRGDAINSGDKISTRAGRLQVRFTDGGFVSLQPNSVFAVDEYLYTNRKPEETSLFFSLLQGGMRTITGTIGKVNKKSYQVRTPVATIGIRGTEYLASLGPKGLIVSVGAGFVNVENGMGNVTAGARQNVAVRDNGSAPALSEEQAEVQASTVNGDQETPNDDDQSQSLDDKTIAIGDVRSESGDYLFLFQDDGFVSGPGYSVVYAAPSGVDKVVGYDTSHTGDGYDATLDVTFDESGMAHAYQFGESLVFDRYEALGGTTSAIGDLKWGAWGYNPDTDGTVVRVNGNDTGLGVHDYVHYIVGRMTPLEYFTTVLPGTQSTYVFQDGTLATGSDGRFGKLGNQGGSLTGDHSTLTVQFGTSPSVSANLYVNMDSGNSYHLTGTTTANLSVFGPASASGMATFSMSGMTCNYQAAGSGGCSGSVAGLFAGATAGQIGLSYRVDDSGTGTNVSGTGAFTRASTTVPTSPPINVVDGGLQ